MINAWQASGVDVTLAEINGTLIPWTVSRSLQSSRRAFLVRRLPVSQSGRRGRTQAWPGNNGFSRGSSDGYLQILQLAEREAQWLDACVHNFGLDYDDVTTGLVESVQVPKPAVTDRATASALLAAFGSARVRACHAAWRSAADSFSELVRDIHIGFSFDGPPYTVDADIMKKLTEDLQPKERAARQALAEAVASELGHR